MGHVLPRRTPTGEVLERRLQRLRRVRRADRDHRRAPARSWSPTSWSRSSCCSTSPQLGVLVLVAAPVLVGRRAAAAAPAAPPPADRARPQLRPDLDGDRHRGRACGSCAASAASGPSAATTTASRSSPARPGSSAGIWQAAIEAVGVLFSGVFIVLLVWLGTREVISGELTDRPADQLPRLRAVHDLPDPDLLRARPEGHPGAWCSARKAVAIFEQQPPWPDRAESTAAARARATSTTS